MQEHILSILIFFPALAAMTIGALNDLPSEDQVHIAQELLAFANREFQYTSDDTNPVVEHTQVRVASVH